MDGDIVEALKALESELRDQPTNKRLKSILDTIESDAFTYAIQEFARTTNDPEKLQAATSILRKLLHLSENRSEDRLFKKDVVTRGGVGGGAGIVGASIISVTGPFAVIAVLGGVTILAVSAYGGWKLNDEALTYKQIRRALEPLSTKVKTALNNGD